MTLPSIVTPEFETTIPSTKEIIKFRPFLVKEEKILYIAMSSEDNKSMVDAIKKIMVSCFDSNMDIEKLTFFDFEYLFLQLRAKSVSEISEFSLTHNVEGCEHVNDVSVNIETVEVQFPADAKDVIMITDTVGIKLRYPTINDLSRLENPDVDAIIDLFCDCIVTVFDGDTMFEDYDKKQLREWIENLSQEQFKNITEFFENMPKLQHEIKYTCGGCNEDVKVTLEGLQSFFWYVLVMEV